MWDVAFDVQVSEMVRNSHSEPYGDKVEGILFILPKKKKKMRQAQISQPWTAVSTLLGLISMALSGCF